MATAETRKSVDFIRSRVEEDLKSGRFDGRVVTRFPPEPNGYLHIGHAKAISISFDIAAEYGGVCHLRFDDTNPVKEEREYVEAIQRDIRWLGYDWGPHLYYASDYFGRMYDYAVQLIETGKAYVCTLSTEEFKAYRGVPTRPGKPSPRRDRPIEESLDLFARMRAGEFDEGAYVLRAKIDMASPNLHLRDPALYRILKVAHHRTGNDWCIYPMYDYAHCLEDSIEKVTHSLCSLEFEVHRPLYDWILDALGVYHPQQIEFAKLIPSHTVMSKRRLLELVKGGHVSGWDDPRMPTLAGLRRRGYTPQAIRNLLKQVGVTKYDSLTDVALLEHCVRDDLNRTSPRRMAVMNPLKVVITNYPEEDEETFDAVNNPEDPSAGTRPVSFSRVIYIERDDFMEDPPKKYRRLAPGREVRLRYACYITCTDAIKDAATGEVAELHCTFDPESRGGSTPDGRKVDATIHWVSAAHAVEAEARLYDRLVTAEDPTDLPEGQDFKDVLNPDSLRVQTCLVEPGLAEAAAGERFQFERIGYFCVDPDSNPERLVFNRTVALRDSWAKQKA